MGDMGEMYRDWDEQKKEKKSSNKEYSTNKLISEGVDFESKNGGVHLIVTGKKCLIDYWPSTGKFITRDGKNGRGINNLLKLCGAMPELEER